jgi:hypothetical protein
MLNKEGCHECCFTITPVRAAPGMHRQRRPQSGFGKTFMPAVDGFRIQSLKTIRGQSTCLPANNRCDHALAISESFAGGRERFIK